jgi:hypothetical protein
MTLERPSFFFLQEEKEALEQAMEHQKFRASKKQDEIGVVDETGGEGSGA